MRGLTLKGVSGFWTRENAASPSLKLSRRHLLMLSAAVTALGLMLWYFNLYTPTTLRLSELEASVQGLETQVALGRAARANLPALRGEIARLEAERDRFLVQLPPQREVAELLDYLREASSAAGVTLSALQHTGLGSASVEGVRPLGFSLSTQGTYGQTIAFLEALETLPRFARVERVGLSTNESSSDPLLSASYDFTVFVLAGDGSMGDEVSADEVIGDEVMGDEAAAGEPAADERP
ncbi:type 4a pilus biogenesis protein PilO [Truepera radiovictrix]|uniref:General secretion pathway protein M n=1 Tax=Truepera radiovictrix (strain DSM 17093 / CIP 108686 / LMG 22925 / RQ-24) TaxID=649638 RepID=D7CWU6_TRURR|nr:type 4a pilus biogenesis protein PilO [Truepera radiovictrix]ADI14454.1 General secretion pathway protein M [Truepera radiovictrix DSM 17093]WMT56989.1 type 4a pilus biogenesis protein PilO [Truepera radiovictrix]